MFRLRHLLRWLLRCAYHAADEDLGCCSKYHAGSDEHQEPARTGFSSAEWVVSAPVLRRLPLLLAVISGHINLVGARPRPVTDGPPGSDPWEHIAGDARVGLIGP